MVVKSTLDTFKKEENSKNLNIFYIFKSDIVDNYDNGYFYNLKIEKGTLHYDIKNHNLIVEVIDETRYEEIIHNLKTISLNIIDIINDNKYQKVFIQKESTVIDKFGDIIINSLVIASYNFSYKKDNIKKDITIFIEAENNSDKDKKEEIINIANNINSVRDIVNTPPNKFTPDTMLDLIKQEFSDDKNFEITILKNEELLNENMNLMYSVGKASTNSSILIHLRYKHPNAKNKIALVGKGLTYDSGGLSLKPHNSLISMKLDKGGSALLYGVMKNVKILKPEVEIHCVFAMTENMIAGNSYKPDDVIISKNGLSVEILNTDAEGRLVLADALSYIQEKEPNLDYILDFATLTGASMAGLGEYTFAIMGNNNQLKKDFFETASKSNEYSCELHFNNMLDKSIDSKIADVCNLSSSNYGGALTAGLFLNRFIEEENKSKWLHLDIAGPTFSKGKWEDRVYGATGIGVLTTTNWIINKYSTKNIRKD